MARWLLISAAALLAATALFHMTGLAMVSGWLDGPRGTIFELLWATAAVSWIAIAAIWLYAALRPSPALTVPVWLSALIPLSVGIPLLAMVDARHPGGYLLLLSSALAAAGAGVKR